MARRSFQDTFNHRPIKPTSRRHVGCRPLSHFSFTSAADWRLCSRSRRCKAISPAEVAQSQKSWRTAGGDGCWEAVGGLDAEVEGELPAAMVSRRIK